MTASLLHQRRSPVAEESWLAAVRVVWALDALVRAEIAVLSNNGDGLIDADLSLDEAISNWTLWLAYVLLQTSLLLPIAASSIHLAHLAVAPLAAALWAHTGKDARSAMRVANLRYDTRLVEADFLPSCSRLCIAPIESSGESFDIVRLVVVTASLRIADVVLGREVNRKSALTIEEVARINE